MDILDKHIKFVNEQIAFHDKRAAQFTGDRAKMHQQTADQFRELLGVLKSPQNGPAVQLHRLSLSPEDLEGLPQEQLDELSITSADKAEFSILALMEESGGIMSLDQVIVGLYRQTGTIQKRQTVTSRLYRMAQKELLYNVPNKKGVYSVRRLTQEELAKLK